MAQTTYSVSCYFCKNLYDALRASWCECVVKERTFTCPHCNRCFCKAPLAHRQKFWTDAPQEMWDRKIAEKSAPFAWTNPEPAEVKRPLILLVDDEVEIRAVARRAIEGAGFGLVIARDGQEGLELSALYRPDVVLTDVMMPRMDGRRMGLAIKQNPLTANARIIMMTSLYTDPRYKYEALREFKADDYLTKPLDVEQLMAVLLKNVG